MLKQRLSIFILINLIVLSFCNLPMASNTQEAQLMHTYAAQTIQAITTASFVFATNTAIPQEPSTTSTIMPVITNTTIPTTSIPTAATATNTIPCDKVSFVNDITIPDGTVFPPGTNFTKTWRVKNIGTCTWTNSYKLVFDSGDAMNGLSSIALTVNVPPNGTIDLSVVMKSPASGGNYKGYWKMQNSDGILFGMGPDNKPFWVAISVGTPSTPVSEFAVTSVNTSFISASGDCATGYKFNFKSVISTNKAGTVKYHRLYSDGGTEAVSTLVFSSAGSQTVTTDWTRWGASGDVINVGIGIYIDSPNHQSFPTVFASYTCP
jgi:hypothetical protein